MITCGSTVLRLDFDIFSMRPAVTGAPAASVVHTPWSSRLTSVGYSQAPWASR